MGNGAVGGVGGSPNRLGGSESLFLSGQGSVRQHQLYGSVKNCSANQKDNGWRDTIGGVLVLIQYEYR